MSDQKIYEDLDEMYEDLEDLQEEVLALRGWKAKALPFIKDECSSLGDHLAVCIMELEQGTYNNHSGLLEPNEYIKDQSERHSILIELVKEVEGEQG